MKTARCHWCNREMTVPPNVHVKKWCSTRCKSARIPYFYPHLFDKPKTEPLTRPCEVCGTPFQAQGSQRERRKYCSERCGRKVWDRACYRRRVARALTTA